MVDAQSLFRGDLMRDVTNTKVPGHENDGCAQSSGNFIRNILMNMMIYVALDGMTYPMFI